MHDLDQRSSFERQVDKLSLLNGKVLFQALFITLIGWVLLIERPGADPDLFARIAMGRLVVRDGSVPLVDPFAYTPKKAIWVDHEWLAGLVFYGTLQALGELGLILLTLLSYAAAAIILCHAQKIYSESTTIKNRAGIFILTSLLLLDSLYLWSSIVRSQIFTYVLVPFLFLAIAHYERRCRSWLLWIFPLLMVIWCNAHGGFVVGLGLLGVYLFTRVLRRLPFLQVLSVFLISVAATAVNPYGFTEYWAYILDAVTMHRVSITEWQAPGLAGGSIIIPALLVITYAAALVRYGTRASILSVCIITPCVFYAFRHERLIPLLYMSIIVFGVPDIDQLFSWVSTKLKTKRAILRRTIDFVFIAFTLFVATKLCLWLLRIPNFQLHLDSYPVAAVEWLKENSDATPKHPKRVLIDFNNGSFALWRLYPRFLISLDGRYEEVYPEQTVVDVSELLLKGETASEAAWRAAEPDYVLLSKPDSTELRSTFGPGHYGPQFSIRYEDPRFVIYAKGEAKNEVQRDIAPSNVWIPGF